MLKLDMLRLESPERFQALCFRLARLENPRAMPLAFSSWDGGRDIVLLKKRRSLSIRRTRLRAKDHMVRLHFPTMRGQTYDMIWQVKFVRRLDSATKRKIEESIERLRARKDLRLRKWILCLPIDPTGPFFDWLDALMTKVGWEWEIWGASALNVKLESHPLVMETFFYGLYAELRQHMAAEHLHLVRVRLDTRCQWAQKDPQIFQFARRGNVYSPDLLLDLIVRNTGRQEAVLLEVIAEVGECELALHGVPDRGLLFSSCTYSVSVGHGKPGNYGSPCEPPLTIPAGRVRRFKLRLRDTGYSWRGTVVVGLRHGDDEDQVLRLPAMRLLT